MKRMRNQNTGMAKREERITLPGNNGKGGSLLHLLWNRQVFLLLCLFFVLLFREKVFAGTSPIKNIRININSKLETGDSPGDIKLTVEETAKHEVGVGAKSSLFTVSSAEWGGRQVPFVSVGDELQMVLTLTPVDVTEYFFLGAYQANSFHIEGGYYVSSKREGDDLVLTVKVRAVQGSYDAPSSVDWNERTLGMAFWNPGKVDSGFYHVQLFRNGSRIYEIERVAGNQYNFYPYMTRPGRYQLKVKTLIKNDAEKKYARNSGYTESSELQIDDRDVSDGKGRLGDKVVGGTEKKIGWNQEGNTYIYRKPSGEFLTGWGLIDGYWYYFLPDGKMVKGWQKIDNKWFFFNLNGSMAVGWIKDNGQWYYLVPDTEAGNGLIAGELLPAGWHVIGGRYYYIDPDGKMHKGWVFDQGKWYYLNELENSLEGVMFSGFVVRNEKTYYLNKNGAMETGWLSIDGNWYYFQEDSGEMLKNTTVDGFPLNADGILDQNTFTR